MRRVLTIAALGAAAGWLYQSGMLDPGFWRDLARRERERIPRQLSEALAAGRRAAEAAEERLDREVRQAFEPGEGNP